MDHAYEEPLPNIKMECQKWTEEPLILRRSGTWYAAMATKLLIGKKNNSQWYLMC